MIIRKADKEDIDILARLRIDMLNEEHSYSDEFNKKLYNNTKDFFLCGFADNNVTAFIADDNGTAAMGCVNYFRIPPNDWCPSGITAYVGNIYTVPEFRHRGFAARIMEAINADASERGCERILLNTSDKGEHLYKKIGFEYSPTAMAFYPNGIIPEEDQ